MTGNSLDAPPAEQSALEDWAEDAGMDSIPVLDAHAFESWAPYEIDFGTPSITHIGPDMRILSIDDGVVDPSVFFE